MEITDAELIDLALRATVDQADDEVVARLAPQCFIRRGEGGERAVLLRVDGPENMNLYVELRGGGGRGGASVGHGGAVGHVVAGGTPGANSGYGA